MIATALALSSQLALPRTYTAAGGPGGTPDFAGNPPYNRDCSSCHNGEKTGVLRVVDADHNPIPTSYVPGQKYSWVVELGDADAAKVRWGYELTIMWDCGNPELANQTAGTLAPGDDYSNLKDGVIGNPPQPDPSRKFLTHYGVRAGDSHVDGTFGGQSQGAHWPFSWTAPEKTDPPCGVKIYLVGVSADGDSTARNDNSFAATFPLSVNNPTAARRSTWGWVKKLWR
ncbi:MAG TPA: choice-of-anchor V domain-containing protein [Candidatus Eisenbacteria bacterium]